MNGPTTAETVGELSKWAVGLGMLTMVLAPLSLPFLILTAVAVIPLLLPLLAVAIAVALIAAPIGLIRAAARRMRAGASSSTAAARERRPREASRPAEVWR